MKTQALLQALRERRLRRGVRRRPPRRGALARQGAHLLLPRPLRPVGPEEPAPRAVEPLQRQASTRARASASSRSPTGPSSTSGSTSSSRTSRSCRCTSRRRGPVVERDGALIMVDDERMRLQPGETPRMEVVRFRTLGCYPLSGAVRSTRRRCPRSSRRCCSRSTRERQGRLIDHDEEGSMETKKREGYF